MFAPITYFRNGIILFCILCSVAVNAQRSYDTTEIMALAAKGRYLENLIPDSALNTYKNALIKSSEASFATGIIITLPHISELCINKGLYDTLLSLLQRTLIVCNKSNKLQTAIPIVYDGLGNIYQVQGKYETALQYYLEAIRLIGNHSVRSSYTIKTAYAHTVTAAYDDIGNLYYAQGKYELAMQYYLTAIKLIDQYGVTGSRTAAVIYNNIGYLLITVKRDKEALPYLNKSEEIGRQTEDYSTLGYALANEAIIYMNQKKWEQSQTHFEEAVTISREHKISRLQYTALTNLSDVYLARNMPEKALSYLLETQSLKGDIEPSYQIAATENIGKVYTQLHNYKNAEYYLQKALAIADAHRLPENALEIHKLLAGVYAKTGQYGLAYSNLTASVAMNDSIENLTVVQNLNQLEVKFRTSEKDKQIIRNQLQITRQESSLRRKDLWIIGISAGALLLILLYRNKQHKQRLQEQKMKAMQQHQEIGQLKAMMRGEENERGRLARELHDGIGGMLASINMNLNIAKEDHPEIISIKELNEAMHMVRDTAVEVRKTAHNLMPDILVRHHLKDALIIYCGNINSDKKLQLNLHYHVPLEILDKSVELIIYRIVQELLQNIIKHAQATTVDIQLSLYDSILAVSVEDNGIGFAVTEQQSGYGLQNLRYRVQALQGDISIMSEKGTTVFIEFDLEKLKAA
jgi:signal transduction histidine kinase